MTLPPIRTCAPPFDRVDSGVAEGYFLSLTVAYPVPGLDLLPELDGSKYYHPKKWTQRHRMCVALSLAGWTNNEICEQMDWSTAKVSITLSDPRAAHEQKNALAPIADVALTVSQQLENASTEAFEKTREIMRDATKDDVALKAAFGILDRAGYTPIRRELRLEGEIPADPEVLAAMQKTLAESASIKATYKIIPGEPENEDAEEADYEIIATDSERSSQSSVSTPDAQKASVDGGFAPSQPVEIG